MQYLAARPEGMERVMGIEPTYPAWKAGVLPLNYTRISATLIIIPQLAPRVNIFLLKMRLFYYNLVVLHG